MSLDCRVLVCCLYRARLSMMLTPPTNSEKSVRWQSFVQRWTYEIRRPRIDLQGICLAIIPDGDVHGIYSVGQTCISVSANIMADMSS